MSTSLSSVQTSGLDFGRRDLVFFDLLVERTSRDSEPFCGLFDAAAFLVQHSFDVLFLEFDKREAGIEKRCSHLCMTVEVQVLESDVFLVTQ